MRGESGQGRWCCRAVAQHGPDRSEHKADNHVYLTPEGDFNGRRVASRQATSFKTCEQRGYATLAFSDRIVAKSKDVAAERPP
jgi:hypothetical protein